MQEIKPTQPELKLINPRRTSPMLVSEPRRVDPAPIRRKRNRAVCGIEIVAAVSMALNVIQSVIIYILQAGPV